MCMTRFYKRRVKNGRAWVWTGQQRVCGKSVIGRRIDRQGSEFQRRKNGMRLLRHMLSDKKFAFGLLGGQCLVRGVPPFEIRELQSCVRV